MSALYRLLGPLKPGEERLSHTATIPGATRKDVTEAKCEELLELIRRHLDGTPTIELVYGPKILRELVTGDGVDSLVITAMAIVRKLDPPYTIPQVDIPVARGGVVRETELVGDQGGVEAIVPLTRGKLRSMNLDADGMGWIAPGEYVPPPKPPEQVPNAGIGIPDQVRLTGDWAKPRSIRSGIPVSPEEQRYSPYEEDVAALFKDYLFRAANQRNEALREMADKMLADGEQGIVMIQVSGDIEQTGDDRFQMIDYTKLALHPRVPFGHIYEFRSEQDFLAWTEKGYPER